MIRNRLFYWNRGIIGDFLLIRLFHGGLVGHEVSPAFMSYAGIINVKQFLKQFKDLLNLIVMNRSVLSIVASFFCLDSLEKIGTINFNQALIGPGCIDRF